MYRCVPCRVFALFAPIEMIIWHVAALCTGFFCIDWAIPIAITLLCSPWRFIGQVLFLSGLRNIVFGG